MNDRTAFEKWLLDVHGLESEWQPERNCYKDFPAHLAWQAWQAALQLPTDQDMWDIAYKTSGAVLHGWSDRLILDIETPQQLGDVVRAILANQVSG